MLVRDIILETQRILRQENRRLRVSFGCLFEQVAPNREPALSAPPLHYGRECPLLFVAFYGANIYLENSSKLNIGAVHRAELVQKCQINLYCFASRAGSFSTHVIVPLSSESLRSSRPRSDDHCHAPM